MLSIDAQTAKADSLQSLLQYHTKPSIERVNLLNETSNAFQSSNPRKSFSYIIEAIDISDSLRYFKGKAEALYQMSNYYTTISDFAKVLEYAQKSLKLYDSIDNKSGMSKNTLSMGNIYYFQGDVEKALHFKNKALNINIALKDSLSISHSYANLGTNYCDIGNFALALEYEKIALNIAYQINDEKSISYALNNLGVVYNVQGNYPKALECYQKSFGIDEKQKNYKDAAVAASNVAYILNLQGDYADAISFCEKGLNYSSKIGYKTGLTYNYEYLGLIYKTKGDYPKAIESHNKTLTLQKQIGNKTGVANAYKDLAEIFCLQKKYGQAIEYYQKSLTIGKAIANTQIEMKCYIGLSVINIHLKNYQRAKNYSNTAFVMANSIGNIDLIQQSAKVLSQSKAALGQFEDAYKYHVIFKNMSDSLYNEKNIRSIANIEYEYKFEKEKELLKLEQQKKDAIRSEEEMQQKIIRDSLIFGMVLILILATVVFHSFLQKRKANYALAKQTKQIEKSNTELTIQKEEIQIVASKLEKANITKDKFFSIIAHDLKTPFNGLLGFSELLLDNHTSINNEERETYIKYINDCARKTYNLLENLLTWAQTQKGIINFTPEDINLEKMIQEVIALLKETAGNKGINLISESNNALSVKADKNMLHTILLNLVSNAIKFTPKGGCITLKSTKLINNFAEISVEDTGIGISKKLQDKLFCINKNISTKGTNKESGTGLGLILCKEFVEKHGGNIRLNSEVNKGSQFIFSIPISQ